MAEADLVVQKLHYLTLGRFPNLSPSKGVIERTLAEAGIARVRDIADLSATELRQLTDAVAAASHG